MKKIKSKKNNLLNYFIYDHKYLSKSYLKSCNKFFKKIKNENKTRRINYTQPE
jgi:hypothetical protein|tara:strand:- start:772 stop:930 length:159 start_codon:yes stop_codon:yes gene_type:complete